MTADSALIDRIVHGVLTQLAATGEVRAEQQATLDTSAVVTTRGADTAVEISERIVTADLLAQRLNGTAVVRVSPRAIVTPAAWDLVRERGLTVQRGAGRTTARSGTVARQSENALATSRSPLLIVVRNTPAVDRLYDDLKTAWRRELLGCPDDAAQLAVSAVSRGETTCVVVLAAQPYRAACLANRNEAVKAVAVRDATDMPAVRKQLRANVWCVDPGEKSWFELRNLLRAIERS